MVLFSDFIEGKNVGQVIWDELVGMEKRSEMAVARKLHKLVERVAGEMVFPFHEFFHKRRPLTEETIARVGIERVFREAMRDLRTLRLAGFVTPQEEEKTVDLISRAGGRMMSEIVLTEIHRDMMWGQIIRERNGRLVLVDLDGHLTGQPGKDLADLCAANNFIGEVLPRNKEVAEDILQDLNRTLVETYFSLAKKRDPPLGRGLEMSVQMYLMLRHLHDAAYHLPIWQKETDPVARERHRRYVEISIKWFKKVAEDLEFSLFF